MSQNVQGSAEQFRQSFREEAREILAGLESALLELNENRGDAEVIGRIFRGLHTIKGSGAMFGFERLAEFTHHLESAFYKVRNGRLGVAAELVDLPLAALDQIAAMLEEETEAGDPAACSRILDNVRRLAGIEEIAQQMRCGEQAPSGPAALGGAIPHWRIWFAPGPDLMRY